MVAEEVAVDWVFWWIFVGSIFSIQALIGIVVVFILKGGLWQLLWFRLRGGSLIIHADTDNSIEFGLTKKAKAVEEFNTLDERGVLKKLPTRVSEIKHHLKGSSKPIHICITGQSENTNLLKQHRPDRSAEHLNQWGQGLFQEGLAVGRAMQDDKGGGFFDWHNATTWLAIITACLIIAVAAMQYITLTNMRPPGG